MPRSTLTLAAKVGSGTLRNAPERLRNAYLGQGRPTLAKVGIWRVQGQVLGDLGRPWPDLGPTLGPLSLTLGRPCTDFGRPWADIRRMRRFRRTQWRQRLFLKRLLQGRERFRRGQWRRKLFLKRFFNSIQFNSIQFNSIQFNSIQFNSI